MHCRWWQLLHFLASRIHPLTMPWGRMALWITSEYFVEGAVLKYAHEPTERSGSEYFVKG